METPIDNETVKVRRNELISALQFDLDGSSGDVDRVMQEIDAENVDIWEPLKGTLDNNNISEEYLNEQMVELSYNFSKERFELCQKIARELFSKQINNKVDNGASGKTLEDSKVSRILSKKMILLLAVIGLIGVLIVLSINSNKTVEPPQSLKKVEK